VHKIFLDPDEFCMRLASFLCAVILGLGARHRQLSEQVAHNPAEGGILVEQMESWQ